MRLQSLLCALLGMALTVAAAPVMADTVKVTPLGSHEGEFCTLDRALVFEDPDGTRILYDAGRTVRGAEDDRLGQLDAVLLSHVHGDHLGDRIQPSANAGTCAKPEFSVPVVPNSNSVNIVVGTGAKFLVGAEMASFFSNKVAGAGGEASQVQLVRFGAIAEVGGVTITSVPAAHTNGLNPAFLTSQYADMLKESGLTAYLGPPGGYVVTFSNGMSVYLSGDTGVTAEQDLVVGQFYKPQLAVINIGGTFTTGPSEAAYVMNEMVKPTSVIASHANEPATEGGKLRQGTRTASFMNQTEAPVYLPLSGVTMEFDGAGACVSGCTSG